MIGSKDGSRIGRMNTATTFQSVYTSSYYKYTLSARIIQVPEWRKYNIELQTFHINVNGTMELLENGGETF
jgi:hypothetical protein